MQDTQPLLYSSTLTDTTVSSTSSHLSIPPPMYSQQPSYPAQQPYPPQPYDPQAYQPQPYTPVESYQPTPVVVQQTYYQQPYQDPSYQNPDDASASLLFVLGFFFCCFWLRLIIKTRNSLDPRVRSLRKIAIVLLTISTVSSVLLTIGLVIWIIVIAVAD